MGSFQQTGDIETSGMKVTSDGKGHGMAEADGYICDGREGMKSSSKYTCY